jgi:hypothetical protein
MVDITQIAQKVRLDAVPAGIAWNAKSFSDCQEFGVAVGVMREGLGHELDRHVAIQLRIAGPTVTRLYGRKGTVDEVSSRVTA